jgi:proline iminopeptidase
VSACYIRLLMKLWLLFPALLIGCATASSAPSIREGLWTVRDTKLFVRDVGPKGAPVLLVVHGGPGGNHLSLRPLSRFAPQYRVVLYDQRGSGESERLGAAALSRLTLEENVADIEALRQQLGSERISLIGHSFGGALAIFYAAAHPDRVDKLIVYSGGPEDQTIAGEKREAHMAKMTEEERERLRSRIQVLQAAAEKSAPEDELDSLFMSVAEVMFPSLYCKRPEKSTAGKGRAGFWASQAVNAYIESFQRTELAEKLKKVDRPVLLTWGRCEPSPKERLLYLLDHLPNARMVVFEESGHNAMEEEPDLFFATVTAFLAGTQLPGRVYRLREELQSEP